MIERVVETISRYSMFARGQSVGAAVSGGADSVFLLYVLREIAPRFDLRLRVLHLNHMIRGEEAGLDAHFVSQLAAGLGLPFHAACADVPALRAAASDNLEQAARRARREFFHEAIRSGLVERVATGHTRSDQAETVLFRFLRGAGTAGMAGIRPVTSDGIVRPLLEVSRPEIEVWLRGRGLPWREDSTNADPSFARNRIRHALLPALERDWNPRLSENLARMADIARDEEAFWASEADRAGAIQACADGAVTLSVPQLASIPRALARRVVRRALERVRGDLRGISFAHVESVVGLAYTSGGHGAYRLPGVEAVRSFDWIRVAKPAPQPAAVSIPAAVPGRYLPWGEGGPAVALELAAPSPISLSIKECSESVVAPSPRSGYNETYRTVPQGHDLDWDRIPPEGLTLRGWKPGDQYCPVGHTSQTKLKHLFQRARIPVWLRRTWPVLACGGTIVWTARFGPAAGFAATGTSRAILKITENSASSTES